jgi:Dyp-type peroxidase family
MSDDLTPQQVMPDPPQMDGNQLELEEIQGDVLLGLQKVLERFVFVEIRDVAAFKTALRKRIAHRLTTTREVHLREFQLRDHKTQGHKERLPLVGLNLGSSSPGLRKLIPAADLGDKSFAAGGKAQAPHLNDPVDAQGKLTTWIPPFLADNLDGVFLLAGGTSKAVDDEADRVLDFLGSSVAVSFDQTGNTRPGPARGHEHFGWLDGVSQPGINGLTTPFPGQEMLDPGLFVFGYPGGPQPTLPWMRNGSFMVFRRLVQLVPEFDQFLLSQARLLGMDPVLLGARMVGRWKSGAPLALTPAQDDTALGKDAQQNNDFDFADDPDQRRCPFGAHIRKTNPRKDIPKTALDPHRIIRAGIPFGPEVNDAESSAGKTQQDRGLLFVCYQTSISQQFEFVQGSWSNNPRFVSPIVPKPRPDGSGPVTVGFDPLIGQAKPPEVARTTDEPIPNYPTGNSRSTLNLAQAFIVPTGSGYFFMPSISALRHELTT